jgi:transposase
VLVGNDRREHVSTLTQSLELYDVYLAKMLDCDRKLEVLIATLNNKGARRVAKLSRPRIKTKQVNTPTFDRQDRAVRRARRRSYRSMGWVHH